ncbi:GNAT family N-acetyltransferase [Cryptosporangium aurantiacum]|uniref:Ribosomal protein S18 acetylase RimI n=1 Tax=Cryptosporangium aurantiacum TaxID=134849 RepID=A0A1M7REE4_9ACTN|nr:GNAT family N-acetyltransferase [Cryptosporangium aurantiacum]SHN44687.1 Ribosomal protein S18 acetylase RimI [Cryptosporangium aurantiacum]
MTSGLRLRHRRPDDVEAVAAFLARYHAEVVARKSELMRPLEHPAVIAVDAGRLIGVVTYVVDGAVCELLTVHTDDRLRGVGTALIEGVVQRAAALGCTRLELVTTNDNVEALRFYQRREFRLVGIRPGAVDEARRALKPSIPATGNFGIPIRDEIDLARTVRPTNAGHPGPAQ